MLIRRGHPPPFYREMNLITVSYIHNEVPLQWETFVRDMVEIKD